MPLIDPSGLAGIYPGDNNAWKYIMPFIQRLKRTANGLKLFNSIFNRLPQKVYLFSTVSPLDPTAGPVTYGPWWSGLNNGNTYRIYIPLSARFYIRRNNSLSQGCLRVSTMRLLTHELGHAENYANSEEQTVDLWEDPVMFEIERVRRVSYKNAYGSSSCQ